jgi:hypothetical protein
MKNKVRAYSVILSLILLSFVQVGTTSCTKEVEVIVRDTVDREVIVRDTLEVAIPPIDTLAVLTAKQYHMEEITILQNDKFYYWKRGKTGNTAAFDQEYIKFNANKTGTYFYYGETNTLTWDFVNGNKTRINYTLNRATPVNVSWENISFSGDSLSYSEYYILGDVNSMATGLRLAK